MRKRICCVVISVGLEEMVLDMLAVFVTDPFLESLMVKVLNV